MSKANLMILLWASSNSRPFSQSSKTTVDLVIEITIAIAEGIGEYVGG